MPHLQVTLKVHPDGLCVRWRLDGVTLTVGQPLARLPLALAGAPSIKLDAAELAASDDASQLRLVSAVEQEADDGPVRVWTVQRASVGPIEVSYLARPVVDESRPATPPLELRREGAGLSGALKCFLVLPAGPPDLAFELRWQQPTQTRGAENWMAVSSLGEGLDSEAALTGTGLELLGDTYVMCGDLADHHHRDGQMSTWWLTPPGFDVQAFTAHLGTTYGVMSDAFDAPAHPYRVFLRAHPHRGAHASAHPASFVMAMNPAHPLEESQLYETIAHELVHEWLHLDGPDHEVTWFAEGAADYYSLVLPLREGLLDEDAFLHAINMAARNGYANPQRHLTLQEASGLFFSDFLAHWLPYVRGMFYLADLDARLGEASSGERSVDDVVREVVRRRRAGERFGVEDWCASVEQTLPGDERHVLEKLVYTGEGRPGRGTFAPRLEMTEESVPVLDVGFDAATFLTGCVQGLVPGGPAERAGLAEGDTVELPSYSAALALNADDVLHIRRTRAGTAQVVAITLGEQTTLVPQWHKPGA